MIPNRRDAGTQFDRDVSVRVSACRKRLRRMRTMRASATSEASSEASAVTDREIPNFEPHVGEIDDKEKDSNRTQLRGR